MTTKEELELLQEMLTDISDLKMALITEFKNKVNLESCKNKSS
jgi:hypothetical protein